MILLHYGKVGLQTKWRLLPQCLSEGWHLIISVVVMFMVFLCSGFRSPSNYLLCSITVFVIKCTHCHISLKWWSCLWFPCLLASDGHRTTCFVPSQCLWSNVLTLIFPWCDGPVHGFLVFWLQMVIEPFALFHLSVCDQMYSLWYFPDVMVLFMVSLSSGFRWSSNHLLCSITVFVIKCTHCHISLKWWPCLWFPCRLAWWSSNHLLCSITVFVIKCTHCHISLMSWSCLWIPCLLASDGHRTICFVPSQCLWSNVLTVIFHWCHGPVYGFHVFWLQIAIEPFALFCHSFCDYNLYVYCNISQMSWFCLWFPCLLASDHHWAIICFVSSQCLWLNVHTVIFHWCYGPVYGFLVFWLQITNGPFALFHHRVFD